MKHAECANGMTVRDVRDDATYKVIGERGVAVIGGEAIATATDCGAWVEQIDPGPDGVKEAWVIHWSHLERVTD